MSIKLISDSTCDLDLDFAKELGIEIVPLHILLKDKEYKDRIGISNEEIYEWSEENNLTPTTSAVSIKDCQDVLGKVKDNNDEAIIFTISSKLSTTYNVFKMTVDDLNLNDKVSVIDSYSLSNGIAALILYAYKLIKEGKNRNEIVKEIEKVKNRLNVTFVVSTLTYLKRGGRCPGLVASAGNLLQVHPRINMKEGELKLGGFYKGNTTNALKKYVSDQKEELLKADSGSIFICSSSKMEEVSMVEDYLKSLNHFEYIFKNIAGGVISSHCGPNTLGILYIKNEDN